MHLKIYEEGVGAKTASGRSLNPKPEETALSLLKSLEDTRNNCLPFSLRETVLFQRPRDTSLDAFGTY